MNAQQSRTRNSAWQGRADTPRAPGPQAGTVPGTALEIRDARTGDVPAIVDVVQAAYRGEGGWTTEAHLVRGARADEAEVRTMLSDPAVTLLVAEADGELVGCCYTRTENGSATGSEQLSRAELGLFAVHPSAQGQGLGGRLLEAQAALLANAGAAVLVIQVLQERPELHAWYQRHGFVRTGTAVPFPGDPDDLAVQDLEMDVMERPLPKR